MRRGYQDTQGIFALTAGLVLAASLGLFGLRGVDNASVDAPIGGVTGALSIGRFDAPPAPIALDLPFPALHSWGTEAAAAALAPRMSYSAAIQARDAGDGGAAVEAFRTVAASNHVLAPVAELRLAQLLVSSGDHAGAVPHFMAAADNPVLPHPLRSVAFSEGVSALRAAGDTAGAVAALERRAQDPSATDGQRADAMWRSALIRREQGDGGWVGAAHSAVSTAPASLAAREALDALEATGNNHEVLETALVRYRANQDGIARELYTQIVDGRVQPSPGPAGIATAWYYLGALAERRGATVEAFEAYGRSIDVYPGGHLADDAAYWRGQLAQDLGKRDIAIATYDWLASWYPSSPFAAEAEQRAALAVAEAGSVDAALDRLEGLVTRHKGEVAAEAARWHTTLREAHGRTDRPVLDAAQIAPGTFPAIVAGSGQVTAPLPPEALTEGVSGGADVLAAEKWLDSTFGAQSAPGLGDGRTFHMLAELEAVGEGATVQSLLSTMPTHPQTSPHDLFAIARELQARGDYDASMRVGHELLSRLSPEERLSAPPAVHRLVYPAPYAAELEQAAHEQGIPPLLLLALVRQESRFNPTAGSHVGAQGLTQVMGPTGEMIAKSLGVPWDFNSLHDPATSLRFGAHYLAVQIRQFDGNVMAALAAYNAGPGSAQRWLREQRLPGAEGFMATIDYAETRLYVERVLENYAWYRYAYAGAPVPSVR